ncbi:hypothetical protein THASP1DRAFT_31121 [Thamnocephalis sphaerospora]|uniref:Protein JTB n=1 Tax=Thamnocephalis sphaerospora TaxID=78915 RepID=A0A4V1IWC4_9FUNG|nr:hypothetical protein THASP1DRAFT_31559 [Thamnocephalis sphaerospora]RKP07069.1 hypothetical protein THASP1DRAFT_31121 [Thamnocephalis sphaerospora]|eukprot:RKP06629.1 hypothetical protein THASP1DRAFT_31559 [Thamnocephalis sphaerospora]
MLRRKTVIYVLALAVLTVLAMGALLTLSRGSGGLTAIYEPFERRAGEAGNNSGKESQLTQTELERDYECYATGSCEPCDAFELKTELYCKETGNKEPIKCTRRAQSPNDTDAGDDSKDGKAPLSLPKFRSCVTVKWLERSHFFQFQMFNFVAAVAAVLLVIWRRRKIQTLVQRRLTRRIAQI